MIVGTSTRVPATLDALIELFEASADLVDVQILDGPAKNANQIQPDSVCVAPSNEDQPGVSVAYDRVPDLGRTAYVEVVTVMLSVASYDGSDEMKPRRDRCQEIIAAIGDVLEANPRRDGVWDEIGWGAEASWHFVQAGNGATCAAGLLVQTRSLT